ncbi:MAG: heparinase II/III-family protein [Treponema sp.]|jgi:hypothetical protein|nr:heparinase II/III-family protein [Treponema sp.]
MFEQYYFQFRKMVIPADDYRPLSSIEDRQVWEKISRELSTFLVTEGEKYLDYDWPSILATDFMDFSRTGNRVLLEEKAGQRRNALLYLTLAECIENKGRFINGIVNGVWSTCDEATWIVSAHNTLYPIPGAEALKLPDTTEKIKVFIDILGSDVAALIASVYRLVGTRMDEVTPSINRRLLQTLKERIVVPFLANDDFPWMGNGRGLKYINNWTVWVISNILSVTVLTVFDVETRVKMVEKSMYYLDRFLAECPDDGSYLEGSSYWTTACGALLDSLDMIRGLSGGKIDFIKDEKVQNLSSFIYRQHIDGNMFINNADADLNLHTSAQRLYTLGTIAGNETLKSFALALRDVNGPELMVNRTTHPFHAIRELFTYGSFMQLSSTTFPYLLHSWQGTMEIMCEREFEGSSKGLYFSVKGGTNIGSHNHLDTGSFIIFSDGKPAIIDVGRGVYSVANFGIDRNKVISISSEWHNVPYICGRGQYLNMTKMSLADASMYRAKNTVYKSVGPLTELSMELRDVYPADCAVKYWKRIYRFDREKKEITVTEDFKLTKQEGETYLSLVTAEEPVITGNSIRIPVKDGADLAVVCPPELMPEIDVYEVANDVRLSKAWGHRVWRIRLFLKENLLEGKLVLSFKQIRG